MKLPEGTEPKLIAEVYPSRPSANARRLIAAKTCLGVFLVGTFVVLTIYNLHLAAKVAYLEKNLQDVNQKLDKMFYNDHPDVVSRASGPSHNRLNSDAGHYTFRNSEDVTHDRSRRGTKKCRGSKCKVGCHLGGIGQLYNGGRFSGGHQSKTYKWRNPIEEAVCSMRTIPSSDNYHIGIEIPNDGFYYVYTQITFNTNGLLQSGFQTVMYDPLDDNSPAAGTALLASTVQQQPANATGRARDSVYQGGVFYLLRSQYLEVIDTTPADVPQRFDRRYQYSYFGAFFLYS